MVNSQERHNLSLKGKSLYKTQGGKAYIRLLNLKRNQDVLKRNYQDWLHNLSFFDGVQWDLEFWGNVVRKGKRQRYQTKLLADILNFLTSARSFGEVTTKFSKDNLSPTAQSYAVDFAKFKLQKSSNKFLWELRNFLVHQLGKNWVGIKHQRIRKGKRVDRIDFWMSREILLAWKGWKTSEIEFLKALDQDILLNKFVDSFYQDLLQNVDLIQTLYVIEHMEGLDNFHIELNELLIKIRDIDKFDSYPIIESDIRYLRYCKFKLMS